MLDQTQIILIILIAIFAVIGIILCCGFIYNKEGYISIIERKGYYITMVKNKKLLYYLPFLYHKAGSYPINEASLKIKKNKKYLEVFYKIDDFKKYHYSSFHIKDIVINYEDYIEMKKKLQQCGVNLLEIKEI